MKHLLFVSCGRCGTVRLAQILRNTLPVEDYAVVHQMLVLLIAQNNAAIKLFLQPVMAADIIKDIANHIGQP